MQMGDKYVRCHTWEVFEWGIILVSVTIFAKGVPEAYPPGSTRMFYYYFKCPFCSSCLQSWLEQDTSCPTCRTVLSVQSRHVLDAASRLEQMETVGGNRRMPNHFFHFDGTFRSIQPRAIDGVVCIRQTILDSL